ncbi:MAG: hypothetical protein AAB262_11395, partial [Elusimicrobiota bacterium]
SGGRKNRWRSFTRIFPGNALTAAGNRLLLCRGALYPALTSQDSYIGVAALPVDTQAAAFSRPTSTHVLRNSVYSGKRRGLAAFVNVFENLDSLQKNEFVRLAGPRGHL